MFDAARRTTPSVVAAAAAACIAFSGARSQGAQQQVWNEIDGYFTLPNADWRIYAFTSMTRAEEANTLEPSVSANLDYLPLSWGFLRTGFRYIWSITDTPYDEKRALFEATIPATTGRLRFRNRTEVELRWLFGVPSQRYRDRLRVERDVNVRWLRRLVPYATYEMYYDTRYRALSRTGYRVGAVLTFTPNVGFEITELRQDNRFGSPRHVNALTNTLAFHFN
ncbi:MAG TPA: DUF2490 domain-containing protein [Gemmatimonadaceae bacterium]|jgi:hypothetical protein